MGVFKVADMAAHMVAHMEVNMVADKVADTVADMEIDMVADMEMDMFRWVNLVEFWKLFVRYIFSVSERSNLVRELVTGDYK